MPSPVWYWVRLRFGRKETKKGVPSDREDQSHSTVADLRRAFARGSCGSAGKTGTKRGAVRQTVHDRAVHGDRGAARCVFFSDGERLLFSSNRSGIFNVHSLPVRGGEPTALTASTTDNSYAVGYFPQDDRTLHTRELKGVQAVRASGVRRAFQA
jgi:hypothetical protein